MWTSQARCATPRVRREARPHGLASNVADEYLVAVRAAPSPSEYPYCRVVVANGMAPIRVRAPSGVLYLGVVKACNPLLANAGTTIFEAMSALAREHGAVNLGQGFPEGNGPQVLVEVAADYLRSGNNQYPPMMGLPALRQAIAAHHARCYGLTVDWQTEVLVTSGATEALLDCFLGLLVPGDEALVLEPAYDTYVPVIRWLGAVPRTVRCVPPEWQLPRTALQAAVGPRTKLLVLNSPMNPTGAILRPDDLAWLADFVTAHDLYVVCDEVYEHLVFDGTRHTPLMCMPGMRERCVRIGSAGKIFSLTGWKVGYVSGPASLIHPIAKAHQLTTFTTPPALQAAAAHGFALPDAYFAELAASMQAGRDRLVAGLTRLAIPTFPCRATYFVVADMSRWLAPGETNIAFCHRLVREAGVVVIPLAAFYVDDAPAGLVRFAFCKSAETIDAALARLAAFVRATP